MLKYQALLNNEGPRKVAHKKSLKEVLRERKAAQTPQRQRKFTSMYVVDDTQSMNMQGDLNAVIVVTEAVLSVKVHTWALKNTPSRAVQ